MFCTNLAKEYLANKLWEWFKKTSQRAGLWGNIFRTSMNRRDIRFYKITLQLPLGKANATFRKKERKMDKPDVDFSN